MGEYDEEKSIDIGVRAEPAHRPDQTLPGFENRPDPERFQEIHCAIDLGEFYGKESQAEDALRSIMVMIRRSHPKARMESYSIRPSRPVPPG